MTNSFDRRQLLLWSGAAVAVAAVPAAIVGQQEDQSASMEQLLGTPGYSISAAEIETNGWVLALTLTANRGAFSNYNLDPQGTPRLTITTSHNGFAPVDGRVEPRVISRTVVGTKPLRATALVVNSVLQPKVVDEVELGDGTIKVRIALSDFIYATDYGLTLQSAADWRTGELPQSVSVTNGSRVVCPIPIMRWIEVPYQRCTDGKIKLSLVVNSHHPLGLAPVAGVKFTVHDGANSQVGWATTLSSSTTYGDGERTRCYEAIIDCNEANALTAGLVRCDADVYPWVGEVRSTDTSGTKAMSSLGTDAFKTGANNPLAIAFDPGGTRYAPLFTYVDSANGTTTASAAMVSTTLAGAKSVPAANRPATISAAMQALYLYVTANAHTLPAAHSQAAAVKAIDNCYIVLKPGVTLGGATAVTTGLKSTECWVNIVGDPDEADPRASCILRGSTRIGIRASRLRLANLTMEAATASLFDAATVYWWLDNIELRAVGNNASAVSYVAASAPPVGQHSLFVTRSRAWKINKGFSNVNWKAALIRNSESSTLMGAMCIISNRYIQHLDETIAPGAGAICISGSYGASALTDPGVAEDFIVVNNDLRSANRQYYVPLALPAAKAGTALDSVRRQVFSNNICERANDATGYNMWGNAGEGVLQELSYNIFENNSMVGQRCSFGFNKPPVTTVLDVDTRTNIAYCNRIANNAFDKWGTEDDFTAQSNVKSINVAAGRGTSGIAPIRKGCYPITYGVGFYSNYDFGRIANAAFNWPESLGVRSVQVDSPTDNLTNAYYTDDRSQWGLPSPNKGLGQGDYRPASGSPLIGRGFCGNSDRDAYGQIRTAGGFATGALEPVTVG